MLKAYSEPYLFTQIQACSAIFYNDSYNNINFRSFTLVLQTFQRNSKKRFLTTMASISMLELVYLNDTRSLKIVL